MSQTTNAGIVTAYGAAVRGGYQGTYSDFCTDLANLAQVMSELSNLSATAETLVAGSSATATYANGVFTFGIPRGDKGEKGDTGKGIASVSLLSTSGLEKTYRITFTDGTYFDYVVTDGKSIVGTTLNSDYTLTITYNDGTTWTSGSIRGATGATPNLTIGTVTTGAAGTDASASITGTAENPVLNLTIPKGADGDVSSASIASVYDATKTYAVGDYVWYSGQLYKCTTEIATAEAWTAAHWTAVKIADDVNDLKSDLTLGNSGEMTIMGSFSYGVFENNFPVADPRKFNAVMMTAEKYDRVITITAKVGYNFLAYWYDDNDVYIGRSPNWETSRRIPVNTFFRLWVRPNPLDTSIVLDLDTVKQNIVFNTPIHDEIDTSVDIASLANVNAYLSGAGLQMINTTFAYGTMNTTTGQAVSDEGYTYQVIMPNYVTYSRDVTVKCNSGYRYQVWWYNEDDTYISRTPAFLSDADEYTVSAGMHFRLFVTLNPAQTGVVVPIDTFAENVFIRTQVSDRVTAIEKEPLSTLPEYIVNTMSYRPVGNLSKGYILLSCDDGTEGLATYTIPMLINKNVPATFGLLMTSPVINNETYLATVVDAVNNHGCCVAQHGSGSEQWTILTENALNKYFDDTEALFTEKGIAEIHGAICPGGTVADTNTLVQAVAGGRFGAVFSGGLQGELKYGSYSAVGARTNIYAMARFSAIRFTQETYQDAINDAFDNHYILCPFWHDYEVVNNAQYQAVIEGLIDYAKAKGLIFITMADLPNIT